jgi:hypothetical protein
VLAVVVLTLGLGLLVQARAHANTAGDGNISNTLSDSSQPAIAVAPDGERFAAWEEDGTQVYTAVEGQAGWLVGPLADGDSPALTTALDGTAHLVYAADDGTGNLEIYHSRWSAGGWSPPGNISRTSGTSAGPDVAIAADGTPHFVWTDSTPGEPTLYQGTPDGAVPVFSARGTAPAISIDNSDQVHLVWQEPDDNTGLGEVYHIFMRSADGQTWSFAERLSNSSDVDSRTPDIVIDSQGMIHVAWIEGGAVQVRSGQPANFSPAVTLSDVATGTAGVRLAADTAGNVFAAWTEGGTRVRAAVRWASTSAWETPQTVADGLPGLGALALDAGPAGTAYLAWSAHPSGSTAGEIYVKTVEFAPPAMNKIYLPLIRHP